MKSALLLASLASLAFAGPICQSQNTPTNKQNEAIETSTGTPAKLPWKPAPWSDEVFAKENPGLAGKTKSDQQCKLFQKCKSTKTPDENLCGTEWFCRYFDKLDIRKRLPGLKDEKPEFASQDECLQHRHQPSSTPSESAPSPSGPQPQKSTDEQVQGHCARFGNEGEKKACMSAARRCTARVAKDAMVEEFLDCVDRTQVCADVNAPQHDLCVRKAKTCKEENHLPLGALTKLAECAKEM